MKFGRSETTLLDIRDLEAVVVATPDSELRDVDALVLRVAPKLWQDLASRNREFADLARMHRRAVSARKENLRLILLPDITLHLELQREPLYLESLAPLELDASSDTSWPARPLALEEYWQLRQYELDLLITLQIERSIIAPPAGHHFALPSGSHAPYFVRLGDAFDNIRSVDRAAYWLALFIDDYYRATPAACSNLLCLVADCPGTMLILARATSVLRCPARISCLEEYPSDVGTLDQITRALISACADVAHVIAVIGIASSGRLERLLRGIRYGNRRLVSETVVVYAITESIGGNVLCNLRLPEYRHYSDGQACEFCEKDGKDSALHIDPRTYLLRSSKPVEIALPSSLFASQRDFLTRFGAIKGALRVHFDDPNEVARRHHAYYVDVGSLLASNDYCAYTVENVARVCTNPDLILTPAHPTARKLGALLESALGVPHLSISYPFSSFIEGAGRSLLTARVLLVVDDVLIRGNQLRTINDALRALEGSTSAIERVVYYSCLGLVESETAFETTKRSLESHRVWDVAMTCGDVLVLPPGEKCPWCSEAILLERLLANSESLGGDLDDRLSALRGTRHGLRDDLFSVPRPDVNVPHFTQGSDIFVNGWSPSQVAFSSASAVQQARRRKSEPLGLCPATHVVRQVHQRVFEANFREKVVWLGLLRALRPHELSEGLKSHLVAVIRDSGAQSALPEYCARELALTMLMGALGTFSLDAASRALLDSASIPLSLVRSSGLHSVRPDEDAHESQSGDGRMEKTSASVAAPNR